MANAHDLVHAMTKARERFNSISVVLVDPDDTPDQRSLRTRTLTAAARLNHDLTACEREALADELAAIAMELRA